MSQNQPKRGPSPSMPRWVKVFVIIFIALVVLVIILHLMGFGFGSHRITSASDLVVIDRVAYALSTVYRI